MALQWSITVTSAVTLSDVGHPSLVTAFALSSWLLALSSTPTPTSPAVARAFKCSWLWVWVYELRLS
jgi:hypothetical protein